MSYSDLRHYKRTRATKPRNKQPERELQKAVAKYLEYVLPEDVEFTASMSAAVRGPEEQRNATGTGLRKGWPDLQFIINRRTFYIEMKKPITALKPRNPERYGTLDDPDLSDDQRRVMGRMHEGCWAICRSIPEVRDALLRWGVPLRAVTVI